MVPQGALTLDEPRAALIADPLSVGGGDREGPREGGEMVRRG
jgi:hypothetical protein